MQYNRRISISEVPFYRVLKIADREREMTCTRHTSYHGRGICLERSETCSALYRGDSTVRAVDWLAIKPGACDWLMIVEAVCDWLLVESLVADWLLGRRDGESWSAEEGGVDLVKTSK